MNPRFWSSGEELLHAALVAGLGGADEVVVAEAHAVPEATELGGDFVGEVLRRLAGGLGGALDLLAVFVGAGEEPGVVAERAVAARDDVADDRGVGVADVGARVDVIDRRGDVVLVGFGLRHRGADTVSGCCGSYSSLSS